MTQRAAISLALFLAWTPWTATETNAETDDATAQKITAALAGDHRSDANKARDQERHPLETLTFFGLHDDMTVLEIWPEAGWYTEILAPVLRDSGRLIVANFDPEATIGAKRLVDMLDEKFAAAPEVYDQVETGVLFPMTDKVTPAAPGTVDLVLTFRNIHNWMARDIQDTMFASFFAALKPGGYLGVVEHRAKTDQPQDPKAANGYVREDYAVSLAEHAGFMLIARAEINANPKDRKDYPNGVWSLPPSMRGGSKDAEIYRAIGESDRFTLLFQKPKL